MLSAPRVPFAIATIALLSACDASPHGAPAPIAPEPPASAAVAPSASVSAVPSASASAPPAPSAAPPSGDAAKYPVRWSAKLGLATRADLDAALHAKLAPNGEPAELDFADGGTVSVASCAAFLDAVDAGAQTGGSGFQAAQGSFFDDRCTSLWFVREAFPAREGFIDDLRFDRAPLARLPAELAPYVAERPDAFDAAIAKHEPLGAIRTLRAKSGTKDRVVFVDPDLKLETTVEILAFGDVDHDGVEDALAMRSFFSTEGSYRGFTLYVLTQRSARGPVEVTRTIDG